MIGLGFFLLNTRDEEKGENRLFLPVIIFKKSWLFTNFFKLFLCCENHQGTDYKGFLCQTS